MSSMLLAGLITAVALLVLFGYFLVSQHIKNNELSVTINELTKKLGVLRDSQQGLGLQLLGLERQLQSLLKLQAADGGAAQGGTLNEIASRLRDGVASAEIIASLGVSEAEVKLVQMIVANVDKTAGASAINMQQGSSAQGQASGNESEPVA